MKFECPTTAIGPATLCKASLCNQGIRVNAVAPGVVDTPMHKGDPKDLLKTPRPMGQISDVKDIVDAILYLTEASQVTGAVLHGDGDAHVGRW